MIVVSNSDGVAHPKPAGGASKERKIHPTRNPATKTAEEIAAGARPRATTTDQRDAHADP